MAQIVGRKRPYFPLNQKAPLARGNGANEITGRISKYFRKSACVVTTRKAFTEAHLQDYQ